MGGKCSSTNNKKKPIINNNIQRPNRPNIRQVNTDLNIRNLDPFLQSTINPSFNFPEVKENIYLGTGLKKIKGYISNISKEELIKKRKEFWETRIEGNFETWNFLKQICENDDLDEKDIKAYLEANDIIPYKNCINVTYDRMGGIYEIPNYCIQDPVEYILINENKNKPNEKEINFNIKKNIEIFNIQNSNYLSVDILKSNLANKFNCNKEDIRLFFTGKEMMNDKEIWFYDIDNNCTITAMITKINDNI
jgi:hypothetical protein